MVWGLLAASAAALALAAPSLAQNEPEFTVVPYDVGLGRVADTELDLTLPSSTAAAAKIVIYVAPGYTADLGQAAGTKVGDLFATVAAGGASLDIRGEVVADNPANYASLPAAQACAPGTHTAVWVITITLGGTTLRIPMYVDPTAGAEASLGSYKLQVCFSSPYVPESAGGAPLGARLTEADLDFPTNPGIFHNPSARGIYRWRALVTPYTPGTATPNAAGTYELRSLASLPTRIAIKGKYDTKRKRAVITGTFRPPAELGFPATVVVEVFRTTAKAGTKHIGRARTKKGKFTFRTKQAKGRAAYTVLVAGYAGSCTGPPAVAPAGCTRETVAPIFSNFVTINRKK
jgi:hypothetical protein